MATPVYRGSTIAFEHVAQASDRWNQLEVGYTYGLDGTPTSGTAAQVCELEKGLARLSLPASRRQFRWSIWPCSRRRPRVVAGKHLRGLQKLLKRCPRRFGVDVSYYPPDAGVGIRRSSSQIRGWCGARAPGSITMEVHDLPAIAQAAHEHGAMAVLDNTWGAGIYLDAFAVGMDVTMQALTKYVGGHSDLAAWLGHRVPGA